MQSLPLTSIRIAAVLDVVREVRAGAVAIDAVRRRGRGAHASAIVEAGLKLGAALRIGCAGEVVTFEARDRGALGGETGLAIEERADPVERVLLDRGRRARVRARLGARSRARELGAGRRAVRVALAVRATALVLLRVRHFPVRRPQHLIQRRAGRGREQLTAREIVEVERVVDLARGRAVRAHRRVRRLDRARRATLRAGVAEARVEEVALEDVVGDGDRVGVLVGREQREARRHRLECLADVRDERGRGLVDVDVVVDADRAAARGRHLLGRVAQAKRREVDRVAVDVRRGERVVEEEPERGGIRGEDDERSAEVVRLRRAGDRPGGVTRPDVRLRRVRVRDDGDVGGAVVAVRDQRDADVRDVAAVGPHRRRGGRRRRIERGRRAPVRRRLRIEVRVEDRDRVVPVGREPRVRAEHVVHQAVRRDGAAVILEGRADRNDQRPGGEGRRGVRVCRRDRECETRDHDGRVEQLLTRSSEHTSSLSLCT